jgi:hypothetical protein
MLGQSIGLRRHLARIEFEWQGREIHSYPWYNELPTRQPETGQTFSPVKMSIL